MHRLDPIWTVKTGSLFLFSVDAKELFLSEGLTFIIMEFDALRPSTILGTVSMAPKDINSSNGERLEFKLNPPPGGPATVPGYLAIRCRRASDYDIKFMKSFASSPSNPTDATDLLTPKGNGGNIATYFRRQTRTAKDGKTKEVRT
jgi:hypothetical protein